MTTENKSETVQPLEARLHAKTLGGPVDVDLYMRSYPDKLTSKPDKLSAGQIMELIEGGLVYGVTDAGKFSPILTVGVRNDVKILKLRPADNDWKTVHAWYIEQLEDVGVMKACEIYEGMKVPFPCFKGKPEFRTGSDYEIFASDHEDDMFNLYRTGQVEPFKILDRDEMTQHLETILKDKSKALVYDSYFPAKCPNDKRNTIASVEDVKTGFDVMIARLLK